MIMSNALNKRFCKDSGLNINVFEEPYFSKRLAQFSKLPKYKDIIDRYNSFKEMLSGFSSEGSFLERIHQAQMTIVDDIQVKPEYKEMQEMKLKSFDLSNKIRNNSIYNMQNVKYSFISIDLVKANFQVMKLFNKNLVSNADTYDEFLDFYLRDESEEFAKYLKKSKYFRQLLFGNLNPKRQQAIQKQMIENIISAIYQTGIYELDSFVSKTADEVVIDVTYADTYEVLMKLQAIEIQIRELNYDCRVEFFELDSIIGRKHFVKRDKATNDIIDVKGVEGFLYPQVLRRLFNEEIQEDDMVFYAENQLSRFLKKYDER